MNTRPEKDALEQRLRQMADSLEVPSALSPENLLRKLPERRAAPKIQIRRYSAAAAIAACLLVVVTSGMLLRNFSGGPVIQPESSAPSAEESSRMPESSEPAESSAPSEPAESSSQAPESSLPSGESQPGENPPGESSGQEEASSAPEPPAVSVQESSDPTPSQGDTPEGSAPETPDTEDGSSGAPAAKLPNQSLSEAYQEIYDALAAMSSSSVLDAPSPYALSSRAAGSVKTVKDAEEAGIAKASGNILCSLENVGEETKVRVYRLLGKSSGLAAEIRPEAQLPVFQGLYLAYTDFSGLYLQGDLLILLGSAQYISEESDYSRNVSLSFAVFYDLSNPKIPQRISTLAQEGSFLTSVVREGRLMLFSQYPLLQQDLVAEEVESYVPNLYCNGSALLPDPSRIQIGQASGAPVYSCMGLIDLQNPMAFADSLFYLGRSDGLYLQGDLFCTSQISGGKTLLTLFAAKGGQLSLVNEQLLDGTLFGSVFFDRKTRAIRAALLKEDGSGELALLDRGLEVLSRLAIPAEDGMLVSLEHKEYATYFYDEAGGVRAADCSVPKEPQLLSRQEDASLPSQETEATVFPYGQKALFQAEATLRGENPGLLLSLSQNGGAELAALLLPGDIDADFFYDPESLMLESRLGLIGFSAAVYSEDGQREHAYFLLRYDGEGKLSLVGQYSLPAGDYSRGFLKNGNLYVSASGGLLVIDAGNGNVLAK